MNAYAEEYVKSKDRHGERETMGRRRRIDDVRYRYLCSLCHLCHHTRFLPTVPTRNIVDKRNCHGKSLTYSVPERLYAVFLSPPRPPPMNTSTTTTAPEGYPAHRLEDVQGVDDVEPSSQEAENHSATDDQPGQAPSLRNDTYFV